MDAGIIVLLLVGLFVALVLYAGALIAFGWDPHDHLTTQVTEWAKLVLAALLGALGVQGAPRGRGRTDNAPKKDGDRDV